MSQAHHLQFCSWLVTTSTNAKRAFAKAYLIKSNAFQAKRQFGKKKGKGVCYKHTSIPQHLLSLRVREEPYYLSHLSLVLPGILSKLLQFQSEKKNTSQQVWPEVTASDSGTSEKRPLPVEEVTHNMPATLKKIASLTTVACESRATRAPLRPPHCRFMFQSTAAKPVHYSCHAVQESRAGGSSHSPDSHPGQEWKDSTQGG